MIIGAEDANHAQESRLRLARVGIENVAGYLERGIAGWIESGRRAEYIPQITVQDLAQSLESREQTLVVDVREASEIPGGAIQGSVQIPLGELTARVDELDRNKLVVAHCKSGYRSSIAVSLLRRAGFEDVANLIGGFDAWKAAGLPCVAEGGREAAGASERAA